jgi:hypothetical protein
VLRPPRLCSLRHRPAREAHPQVFDVGHRLLEQLGDVFVVEFVANLTAVPTSRNEAEVAQESQLVGDGRGFHPDGLGKLANRASATMEARQDAEPARRRQRVHRLGHPTGERLIEQIPRVWFKAVAHSTNYT